MNKPKIYGLILAGGRGSRMDGLDKGLAKLKGKRLITHCLKSLAPQVSEIVISANRHLETYAKLKHNGTPVQVVADVFENYQGPLAGMHAGLVALTQMVTPPDYVLVMPTDTPHMPKCLVERLYSGISKASLNCAYVTVGGAMHPLTCLVKLDVLPTLQQFLLADDRRVRNWITRLNSVAVAFDDYPDAFTNYNTAAQLRTPTATKADKLPKQDS